MRQQVERQLALPATGLAGNPSEPPNDEVVDANLIAFLVDIPTDVLMMFEAQSSKIVRSGRNSVLDK